MAISVTAQNRADVSDLYVALFGRAPDGEGLGYWSNQLSGGQSLTQVANAMFNTTPARAFYPTFQTNADIINSFYSNVLGRTADTEGGAYWTGQLNQPTATPGSVIVQMIAAIKNFAPSGRPADAASDALGTASKTLFLNKGTLALAYGLSNGTAEGATNALTGAANSINLTVGADVLNGTAGKDIFTANVLQNAMGAQVNSFGSGDKLNGGAGIDSLMAKVTAGAYINGQGNSTFRDTMPIEAITKSVEIVKFQASEAGIYGPATNTNVYVNAKDMEDVTQMWSSRSDADLVIQNFTTKGLSSLPQQTLGMEYTGNADSRWGASDYTVYYDQDYLTAGTTRTDAIEIRIVNNLELKVNNKGLVAFEKVSFAVAGVLVTVNITPDIKNLTGNAAYNALVVAIQQQLVAQNITGVTISTLPVRTAVFTDDLIENGITYPRGTESGTYTPILVTSTGGALTRGQANVDNTTLNFNGLNTQLFATNSTDDLVTVNVALEKVGVAGDGGAFTAGSMNKNSTNTWNAKTTVVDGTKSGIEQFNVSVGGNNTKSSSLATMQSTNNNLKVVNVSSADTTLLGGTFANLTIGNSNTPGYRTDVQFQDKSYQVDRPDVNNQFALKDVKTFNAAGLKGDLKLTAALTQEVTAKYLNVVDNGPNPTTDNVVFTYTSGSGNDYVNLYLDPANFPQPGTVTREDMSLIISTGLGNDEVVVGTGTLSGEGGSITVNPNWYENQHINANLKMVGGAATGQLLINTGVGNDIVRTLGFGDYAINAGDGLDTVYLDNTGGRAVWTINDVNTSPLSNLLSQPAAVTAPKIANLFLNVAFKGFDSKVPVGGSSGSATGVSVNDLTINQAIKAAINLDPVLNKLLIAEDGPGRTLVITSLIDGVQQDANLFSDVVMSLSTELLTPSQSAAFALSPAQATALGFGVATTGGFGATLAGRFDANLELTGSQSAATADNLVVGGLGNDVLVLGTGAKSNDTVGYSGFGNGTDSIVNFDTTFLPAGAITYNGGTKESVNLTFAVSDGSPTSETIVFDGVTVVLAAPSLTGIIPAADVANQFTDQYNLAAASNGWSAVYTGGGNVTLTRDIPGNVTDLTPADFTGTYFGTANGNGSVTTVVTQGTDVAVPATNSTYTVTYTTATTAVATPTLTSVTGENVGDGAFTLIGKAQAFPPAGYTAGPVVAAVDGSSYSVKFTASATGAVVLPTDASYGVDGASTSDGVNGTYVGTLGTVATTTTPVGTPSTLAGPGPGVDALDFTSYAVKAVFVGAGLVKGVVPVLGETYILMTQSTTNPGEYKMEQYTEAGAVDTLVGVVGIADFGATQAFIPANFVI